MKQLHEGFTLNSLIVLKYFTDTLCSSAKIHRTKSPTVYFVKVLTAPYMCLCKKRGCSVSLVPRDTVSDALTVTKSGSVDSIFDCFYRLSL